MIYGSLIFISLGIFLGVISYLILLFNKNTISKNNKNKSYAVLIPARNESSVIENLLLSIENQSLIIPSKDIYVIVEDPKDKTVSICKKHGVNISFRHDLEKQRKGYALDDLIKEIKEAKKEYDAYFIFDADNVLDKDFFKEMSKTIDLGYDIGVGYRNAKNSNSLVSASSALTFSMINTLSNQRKNKYFSNITISGTGYYIKGDIISRWQGFPFTSLTEDYELTLYATLHDFSTYYNTKAIFYDEQPDDFSVSITQRSRWVKGYFEARRKYVLKIFKSMFKTKNFASKFSAFIGVRPYIYLILGILFLIFDLFLKYSFLKAISLTLGLFFALYAILVFFTLFLIQKEKNNLSMKTSKIKVALYHPFFLISFVYCLMIAFFKKDLGWESIKHNKTM